MSSCGALVLAGGRASRLGGAAKPLLRVGDHSLLDGVLAAAAGAGCAPIVVAGPQMRLGIGTPQPVWVREEPPFGGPVAGIAAALPLLECERVVVLAADLAAPARAIELLMAHAAGDLPGDGACLADPDGRPQWLTGVYRTDSLRRGLAELPAHGRDASLRALLGRARVATVPAPREATHDVDTWEDLEEVRAKEDLP